MAYTALMKMLIYLLLIALLLSVDTACGPEISNINGFLLSLSLCIRPGSCLTKLWKNREQKRAKGFDERRRLPRVGSDFCCVICTRSGSVRLSWGQLNSITVRMLIGFDNSTYHTQMFLE